jgi:bacterioferritin-associated ferredoxin
VYLCICKAITEARVRRLAASGVRTPEAMVAALRLDDPDCCGRCRRDVRRFMLVCDETLAPPATPPARAGRPSFAV